MIYYYNIYNIIYMVQAIIYGQWVGYYMPMPMQSQEKPPEEKKTMKKKKRPDSGYGNITRISMANMQNIRVNCFLTLSFSISVSLSSFFHLKYIRASTPSMSQKNMFIPQVYLTVIIILIIECIYCNVWSMNIDIPTTNNYNIMIVDKIIIFSTVLWHSFAC